MSLIKGDSGGGRVFPWAGRGKPVEMREFADRDEWNCAIDDFALEGPVPIPIRRKYDRALRLYRLGWDDIEQLKSAELIALTALELALTNGLGKRPFAHQLKMLVDDHGVRDGNLRSVRECAGTAIGRLTGSAKPSLADIRNGLAHGDPFESPPFVGLMPLVRDLIEFVCRLPEPAREPLAKRG